MKDNLSLAVNRQGKQSLIPLDKDHGRQIAQGITSLIDRGSGEFTVGTDDGEKVVFQYGGAGEQRSSEPQQNRSPQGSR